MTHIIKAALEAAKATIEIDRTSLADTSMRHDNTMDPDGAQGVAEYDAVLAQIDAGLAALPDTKQLRGALELADQLEQRFGNTVPTKQAAAMLRWFALSDPSASAPAVMTDEQATLLNQAHDMLLAHADDQRSRGNDSEAKGAECSADAVLKLAAAWASAPAPEHFKVCDRCDTPGACREYRSGQFCAPAAEKEFREVAMGKIDQIAHMLGETIVELTARSQAVQTKEGGGE